MTPSQWTPCPNGAKWSLEGKGAVKLQYGYFYFVLIDLDSVYCHVKESLEVLPCIVYLR